MKTLRDELIDKIQTYFKQVYQPVCEEFNSKWHACKVIELIEKHCDIIRPQQPADREASVNQCQPINQKLVELLRRSLEWIGWQTDNPVRFAQMEKLREDIEQALASLPEAKPTHVEGE